MMARRWMTLLALVAAAGLARLHATPVAQLDVWTAAPVALSQWSADQAHLSARLSDLGEIHLRPIPGTARAAVDPTHTILAAVEVRQVAPDRIRIRLAADDANKGHAVVDAVREGYVANGLPERLRLASTTTGGFGTTLAQIVGALAALALLCEIVSAFARRRRLRSA